MFINLISEKKHVLKFALALLPVLLLILFFTKSEITLSSNETSRLATVESLVERGTFSIDNSFFKTEDKVLIGGKFYSDKPFLLPLFLSGIYKPLNLLGLDFKNNYSLLVYIMNFAGGGLFAFLIFAFFFKSIMPLNLSFSGKYLLSASLIFSTWIFSFSVTLNNHVPAAFFLFLFSLLFLKIEKTSPPRLLFLTGFISGIVINIDIPAGLLSAAAAGLFLILVSDKKMKSLSYLSLGFAFPFCAMLGINYATYGNILPAYAVPGAYDFPGNIHSSSMAGLNEPEHLYLFNILFGYRGLFSYMPALLFIVPYLLHFRKNLKLGTLFIFAFIFSVIGFYSLMTGDYGGWSYGFRFLVPIIPLLWFYICKWFAGNKNKILNILFTAAIFWGVITSMAGAYNPWPVCYEGKATNKGTVEKHIKNPFLANIFCISREFMPSSTMAEYLETDIYGTDISKVYIPKAFMNMKKFSSLENPLEKETALIAMLFYLLNAVLLFTSFLLIIKTAKKLLCITIRDSTISKTDYIVFLILYTFILSCLAAAALGYCGLLKMEWTVLSSIMLFLISKTFKSAPLKIENNPSTGILKIIIPALIFNIITASAYLPMTAVNWDAMTYHLYFPARWVQEGMIFHIPSVFGDNAPAFFPKCWMLFLATFMAITNSDSLICVIPLIFLSGTAFCLFRISVLCGTDKTIAAGVATVMTCLPALTEYTFSANADMPMLFFIFCALMSLLYYQKCNRISFGILTLLSCGAAAGTKTVGLLFVLPLVIIIFISAIRRKNYILLALCPFIFMLSGGWCYIENMLLYGNPFFPLDVNIANVRIFAGAYSGEAVKTGEFHSSSIAVLNQIILKNFGTCTFLLMTLSLLGCLYGICKAKSFNIFRIICFIVLVCWILSYIFIVPHNMETRFLFPALILTLPGLGVLLDEFNKKNTAYLIIMILCVFLIIPGLLVAKAMLSMIPLSVSIPSLLLASASIVSMIYILFFKYSRTLQTIVITILFLSVLFALAKTKDLRVYSFFSSDYAPWLSEEFKPFNMPDGINGTIAYTGNNLPYILTGDNLKNKVVYCNVQGSLNDSFYDFWKIDKKIYNSHKPPVYRDNSNYEEWIKNIEASGADFLVISVLYPTERKYISSDENGYPVEEAWASEHKDKFIPAITGKFVRIYRINR